MKSEKEKMLDGEIYNAYDEELVKGRIEARKSIREFNDICEDEPEKREEKSGEFLEKPGKIPM